jgi:aryl-alcohol dehydrogenase-like predicted oxidoreductase
MKNFIYGMSRFCDLKYGYGSSYDFDFNRKKFINDISKKIKIVEFSTCYKKSVNFLRYKNSFQKFHFKIHKIYGREKIEKYINENIYQTLKKLNINYIDVLYLHENNIKLISNKEIHNILFKLLKQNLIKNVGVSLYNENEIEYAIYNDLYSYIQIPINITDSYYYQKFQSKLKKKNIVARSIFLQGTLLNPILGHKYKKELNNYLKKIRNLSNEYNLGYYELITLFVLNLPFIKYYLFGSINYNNTNTFLKLRNIKLNQCLFNKLLNLSYKKKRWSNPKIW